MWRLSFLFLAGSIALVGWIAYELGLLSTTSVVAGEKPPSQSSGGPGPAAEAQVAKRDLDALDKLELSLAEREKQLARREAELQKAKQELVDKEAILVTQSARYEKVLKDMEAKVARLESLNEQKAEGFRKIYEKMETKKVASLLSEMEPYLAAEILGNMRRAQAAEILSKMPNEKVRALTEKYLVKRFTASSNHQPGPPAQ